MAITDLVPSPEAKAISIDKKKICVSPKDAAVKSRSVSFDESKNVMYDTAAWTKDDFRRRWYRNSDYKVMKDTMINLARSIWRKENELGDSEDSFKNVVLRVHSFCLQAQTEEEAASLPKDDKKLLKKTLRKFIDRAGIEKVCITEVGSDKRQRRGELYKKVLGVYANSVGCSLEEREEQFRKVSERVSLPSRLFAQHMAVAIRINL